MMSSGLLKIDTSKIKEEEKLDGKYLIRTSDDTLSAEDIALGYKQLLEVESAFRTLKSTLELRPVYHRLEDRIRAHVLLCWLALEMFRIAENELQNTWPRILKELQKIHLGEFQGREGLVWQCTELTPIQKGYFRTLKLKEPPCFMKIRPGLLKWICSYTLFF